MSTISQALVASSSSEQCFAPVYPQEDRLTGKHLPEWRIRYSRDTTSMSDDMEILFFPFVQNIFNAPTLIGKLRKSTGPFNVPALVSLSGEYFDGWWTMESWTPMEKINLSRVFLGVNNQLNTFWSYPTNECPASELAVDRFSALSGLPSFVEREIAEFSEGVDGLCPTPMAIRLARALSKVALQHVQHPEISLDIDGELSFDLRLNDGRLVFAELGLDGQLDVGVYGSDNRMLAHNAKATYRYFLSIIKP